MTNPSNDVICQHCGHLLTVDHSGPCPNCGKTGKLVKKKMAAVACGVASISWKSIHEYYENNRTAKVAVIVITALSPLVGLVLAGIPGVIVGLILGGLAYFISPYAVTKVREIRHGGSSN